MNAGRQFEQRGRRHPDLVGREHEQSVLRDLLEDAHAGRGSVVLVGGEAGIGKTALIADLARQADARGFLLLTGHCYDLSNAPPYGPWRELLETVGSPSADASFSAAFQNPNVLETFRSQDALFSQAWAFLTELSQQQPLLLVLEDLHWSDPTSLDLLRYVSRGIARYPIVLVATYRDDELTHHHPLFQFLPHLIREAGAVRITLRQLDRPAQEDLVHHRYHLRPVDGTRLVDFLDKRADGNPLFVQEVLRTLEDRRLLKASQSGWIVADLTGAPVPPLVMQLIEGRLRRLSSETRHALEMAAMIGQEIPLDLWQEVSRLPESLLARVVEEALAAHLLEEAPLGQQLRFTHALVRQAIHDGVVVVRRRSWHRQIAEALVPSGEVDPDRVAYHFDQAGDRRAADWLIRAGQRAERAYAWPTASVRWEAALVYLDGDRTRRAESGWLRLRIGLLLRLVDPHRSVTYLEEAIRISGEVDDPILPVASRFFRGMIWIYVTSAPGEVQRRLDEMQAALQQIDQLVANDTQTESSDHRRADVPNRLTHLLQLSFRGVLVMHLARLGYHRAALELAARTVAQIAYEQPATYWTEHSLVSTGWIDTFLGLGYAYTALGRPDEARAAFVRAREAYRQAGHYSHWALSWFTHVNLILRRYSTDDATERARLEAEDQSTWQRKLETVGLYHYSTYSTVSFAALVVEEDWSTARALAWTDVPDPHPLIRDSRSAMVATLALLDGDSAAAWDQVRQAMPDGPATAPGERSFLPMLEVLRVAIALCLDVDDLDAAKAWLTTHDRWLDWGEAVLGRAEGHRLWARCYRQAGSVDRARRHVEQARLSASDPRQPLALIGVERALGELATTSNAFDIAGQHLAASLALADVCQAPYERALSLLALAELHLARRLDNAALPLLTEVEAIGTRLQTTPVVDKAATLKRRVLDGHAGPTSTPIPAGLTAREVEVLRLVAEGLTDAHVADRLFLSPRTVSHHLRSIYTKIGVSSRTAAARFAAEHQLLE